MLNANEAIEIMHGIQAASYPSIDTYLLSKYGIDYKEFPLYTEIKEMLEATMVLEEVQHPAGYTVYEWMDR